MAKLIKAAGPMKMRLGTIRGRELASSTARVAFASLVAAVAAWGAARILSGMGTGPLERALPGLAGVVVFGALYFAVVWGLGSRELVELSGPIRRRLARRARRD